ncbi:Streptomyces sporulation and cell division protein, SsgA [Amycolatopsis sacchari]|uniref:Streptomyces sporulation and cell division protein, SsgA n=1 Tax=Amycolatopsis sacchari TaxID=115433 RepID=A0A1I4A8H5_9PSEU|nr:SsgA family sporulation/cell division regulator [Amycolatopsis sacchari]SFK52614.1 Streptomyces sporulation and cell division protein, SsgA [Amycolatopsis sacchari]
MLPTSLNLPLTAEWEDSRGAVVVLRPVPVKFRYSVADPFAVVLDFATGAEQWVRWTFARDLLAEGLADYGDGVGEGDVFLGPDATLPWRVWLTVSSPSGVAAFAFRRSDLTAALGQTEALVPPGTESEFIDWNREFAVLGGEAA